LGRNEAEGRGLRLGLTHHIGREMLLEVDRMEQGLIMKQVGNACLLDVVFLRPPLKPLLWLRLICLRMPL
jgi:hypothetical protein